MRRLISPLVVIALLLFSAASFAQTSDDDASNGINFTATVQTGPSLFFVEDGPNRDGFNLDFYPGIEVVDGLAVEFNVGFRSTVFRTDVSGTEIEVRDSFIAGVLPGVRYEIGIDGPVRPYVHAHLGLGFTKSKATAGNLSRDQQNTTFAFNYGAGVNAWFTDVFGFTSGVTVRHHVNNGMQHILDFNLGASVKF
jgi:opacity protein-like surface antigen